MVVCSDIIDLVNEFMMNVNDLQDVRRMKTNHNPSIE